MDNEKFQEMVLQQFQAIAEELEFLKDSQQRLETKVDKLEVLIESGVIDKISALFNVSQKETGPENLAGLSTKTIRNCQRWYK